jgi:hypothetical protein
MGRYNASESNVLGLGPGCLPVDQFVPQLMEHLDLAYYAGLLTAASLHGAAH